eukprot:706062-Amorphochlora_amoeboformis.AAC.1
MKTGYGGVPVRARMLAPRRPCHPDLGMDLSMFGHPPDKRTHQTARSDAVCCRIISRSDSHTRCFGAP